MTEDYGFTFGSLNSKWKVYNRKQQKSWAHQCDISYQNLWFVVSPFFDLGIKYKLEPLQADIEVCISTIGVRIMPSRSRIHSPITSID